MTELDYVLLAVIVISGLMAVLRGLLREVVGLLGWVVSFSVASRFVGGFAPHLARWVPYPSLVNPLAFFIIFFLILIMFGIVGRLLTYLAGQGGLSVVNRFLGLGFGVVRGVVILMIGLLLFQQFSPDRGASELVDRSLFAPSLIRGTSWVMQRLPPEWDFTKLTSVATDLGQLATPPTSP